MSRFRICHILANLTNCKEFDLKNCEICAIRLGMFESILVILLQNVSSLKLKDDLIDEVMLLVATAQANEQANQSDCQRADNQANKARLPSEGTGEPERLAGERTTRQARAVCEQTIIIITVLHWHIQSKLFAMF